MTIDKKIRDEKLQYDINREVAKISALSSGKNAKYEYLTSEEISVDLYTNKKDNLLFLKQKEIFRCDEIDRLNKEIDFNDLNMQINLVISLVLTLLLKKYFVDKIENNEITCI